MKIYPVFTVALLKRYHSQCLIPNPISAEDYAEYGVEENPQASWASLIVFIFTKMEGVWPRGRYMGP